jgi:uncharacterized protein YecE (DUF72 family)
LLERRLTIYAYFNNHYAGFGPASARAFSEMLDQTIGKRNAEIARPASAPAAHQNELF